MTIVETAAVCVRCGIEGHVVISTIAHGRPVSRLHCDACWGLRAPKPDLS